MKYTAIRSEGGLLPYDLLDEILAETAPGQKAADFGLPKGRRVSDEIQRVWLDAQELWSRFKAGKEKLTEKDPHGTTLTRDRWIGPLLTDPVRLSYDLHYQPSAVVLEGLTFAISHRAGEPPDSPPVHIEGCEIELDKRPPKYRTSPQAMVQEFLNRSELHLWGVVTNGLRFRLLRDSVRTARPTYLEFDLETILEGVHYNEFVLFYRLCHRSRLPQAGHPSEDCWLEKYYQQSIEKGGRVRDKLRDGVEEALKVLGTGFLRHPANTALLEKIDSEKLDADQYHRQLLLLVYRLLFLTVAEDRQLVISIGENAERNQSVYLENYSIGKLRERAEGMLDDSGFNDLWVGLAQTFKLFADSNDTNALGIPPLNGDLFSHTTIPDLESAQLSNFDLLRAVRWLMFYREGNVQQRVNYAALNVEEFGSVYESLLDFRALVSKDRDGRKFELGVGSERKTTGSYYTRPELVRELIQSALLPVMEDRLAEAEKHAQGHPANAIRESKVRAILAISICDPACGSGHFLLEAARRLGKELAQIRVGEDEPTPEQFHIAVRDVISHCIHGVDLNPLAVDLCKLALWLEGHWAGRPLSFLDHRIRCGNSLIGVLDPSTLAAGIPDDAFNPITADDKKIAAAYKKRNKAERVLGQKSLQFDDASTEHIDEYAEIFGDRLDFPEEKASDVRRKSDLFEKSRADVHWFRDWQISNAWTATFFAHLTKLDDPSVPTYSTFLDFVLGHTKQPQFNFNAAALSVRYNFFHWRLEFPDVFQRGGFDAVLGNPPWEMLQPEETKFFLSVGAPEIANLPGAKRKAAIAQLEKKNPALSDRWNNHVWEIESSNRFLRGSGRFLLSASGKLNTYSLFAELARSITNPKGRIGIIVPTGIATDDSNKEFFADVNQKQGLASLYDFENRESLFVAIDSRMKFSLCTFSNRPVPVSQFACFLTRAEQIRDTARRFELSSEDLALFNPNTRTCPIFRTHSDAELTKKIYRRLPVLINEGSGLNPWAVQFKQGLFNMTSDSNLFRTEPQQGLLPLYEAKMFHQFDHRFATYEDGEIRECTESEKADHTFTARPRYWVAQEEVFYQTSRVPPDLITAARSGNEHLARQIITIWLSGYLMEKGKSAASDMLQEKARHTNVLWDSVRGMLIERLTNESAARALQEKYPLKEEDIALMDTANTFVGIAHVWISRRIPQFFMAFRDITNATNERTSIFSVLPFSAVGNNAPLLLSNLGDQASLIYLLANLNSIVFDYVARQKVGGTHMNFFVVNQLPALGPESYLESDKSFLCSRIMELIHTAHDIDPLALTLGRYEAPFSWARERRAQVRAEVDAYFAHLYSLTRDELRYVLNPKEVLGCDFPGETFRVLKDKEEQEFGEYRTQRLVLVAFDELSRSARFQGETRECTLTGKPWTVAF